MKSATLAGSRVVRRACGRLPREADLSCFLRRRTPLRGCLEQPLCPQSVTTSHSCLQRHHASHHPTMPTAMHPPLAARRYSSCPTPRHTAAAHTDTENVVLSFPQHATPTYTRERTSPFPSPRPRPSLPRYVSFHTSRFCSPPHLSLAAASAFTLVGLSILIYMLCHPAACSPHSSRPHVLRRAFATHHAEISP